MPQLLPLPGEMREPLLDERLHFLAGGGLAVAESKECRDVLQRESVRLRRADEPEALERLSAVDSVIARRAVVRLEEPASLVVPNRRDGDTGRARQLTDRVLRFHDRQPTTP